MGTLVYKSLPSDELRQRIVTAEPVSNFQRNLEHNQPQLCRSSSVLCGSTGQATLSESSVAARYVPPPPQTFRVCRGRGGVLSCERDIGRGQHLCAGAWILRSSRRRSTSSSIHEFRSCCCASLQLRSWIFCLRKTQRVCSAAAPACSSLRVGTRKVGPRNGSSGLAYRGVDRLRRWLWETGFDDSLCCNCARLCWWIRKLLVFAAPIPVLYTTHGCYKDLFIFGFGLWWL